jgi:cytochrome c oxidase cbb3-type subunit 2
MNRLPVLFVGIFLTFTSSWLGLVLYPYFSIGRLQSVKDEDSGKIYPTPLSGAALAGRKVYASEGCLYCHSQQIRPADMTEESNRGWGTRRTVARDYINEKPVFLGTMRTGPDLSNIGRRQNSAAWHYKHLYVPRVVSPGSIMPSFSYLFEERKIQSQPSPEALQLDGPNAPKPGYEIVPTQEARNLVAYLLSLDRSYPLKEAPEKQ